MTGERIERLQRAQVKMLRAVLARKRLVAKDAGGEPILESWVDWVRRTTADVREAMQTHQIPEWVDQQRDKANSVMRSMLHQLADTTAEEALRRPAPVHRLDCATSGLVLVARTYPAAR